MVLTILQQTDAPSAGGGTLGEVLSAAAVGSIAIAAVVALGVAHRRRRVLDPIASAAERATGLPGWAALPTLIAGVSLLVAVWGYYWDVSIHIDQGRDEGAFGNPAHWFIIVGLGGIAFAGILALVLGDARGGSSVRLTERWSVPVGGLLLTVCGAVALAGFPLDDIWHRLFGQDVTAWGPTHIQMIGGASLSTIACWVLMVEGQRAAEQLTPLGRSMVRSSDLMLAGAFLIGLSTLQVEFDYGVPQFRLLEHPVLIAVAASIALVTARIRVGRGGALAAVGFFYVVRIALATGVDAFDRVDLHLPLYLGSAIVVELVALLVPRTRPVRFGALAGLGIGTVGFATEWAWSREQMPIGWSGDLLPEAIPLVALAGLGGGLLGGLTGRALTSDEARPAVPRRAAALGWALVVGAIAFALPMTADRARTADLVVEPAGTDERGFAVAEVTVTLDPPDAADDAAWFHVLTWQASADDGPGGASITPLVEVAEGTYRTAEPVIVDGSAKTLLRLHDGRSIQGAAIFLPEDDAIPAPSVPAEDGRRELTADKRLLQREARADNVALERAAYALLAAIAAAWLATISWGLGRLSRGRPAGSDPGVRAREPDLVG